MINKSTQLLPCMAKTRRSNKKSFVLCQGCQAVQYCTQTCMRKHLKQHAQECKKIRK